MVTLGQSFIIATFGKDHFKTKVIFCRLKIVLYHRLCEYAVIPSAYVYSYCVAHGYKKENTQLALDKKIYLLIILCIRLHKP